MTGEKMLKTTSISTFSSWQECPHFKPQHVVYLRWTYTFSHNPSVHNITQCENLASIIDMISQHLLGNTLLSSVYQQAKCGLIPIFLSTSVVTYSNVVGNHILLCNLTEIPLIGRKVSSSSESVPLSAGADRCDTFALCIVSRCLVSW